MILSAGCLIDDCDSEGMLWPMTMRLFISNCHNMLLSAGCLSDDCDSGSIMANEYENMCSSRRGLNVCALKY